MIAENHSMLFFLLKDMNILAWVKECLLGKINTQETVHLSVSKLT